VTAVRLERNSIALTAVSLFAAALLTAALLALAPASQAAGARHPGARANRSAKHGGGGHASGERNVQASLTIELAPAETTLPATQTISLFVPSGIHDAGAKLPQCNPAKLQNEGEKACPKGSAVGSGEASGYTLGVVEPLKMLLYNGPGGSLLTYVLGTDPVSIQIVVQGAVTRPPGGQYGQELAFEIPHGLLEPLPEDPAWLLSLHATLSGKVGWLRATSCPPHGWSEQAKLGYTNGQSLALAATIACM
jgi:hypothetical protein